SRSILADDGHRLARVGSRKRRVAVVQSHFQSMRAVPFLRREVIDLQQFVTATVTMLAIVPTAEVAFGSNPVWSSTVAKDIAVVLLDAEAGLQQRAGFECRLFVERQKPTALVKVGGRLDGVEGVQVEKIKLLRKKRKADGETMFRINHPIHP